MGHGVTGRNEQWHIALRRGHISPLKVIILIVTTTSANRIKFCGIKDNYNIPIITRGCCFDVRKQRSQPKLNSLVFSVCNNKPDDPTYVEELCTMGYDDVYLPLHCHLCQYHYCSSLQLPFCCFQVFCKDDSRQIYAPWSK